MRLFITLISLLIALPGLAQTPTDSAFVRDNYTKLDRQIAMRDGKKLYTVIYVPKDASGSAKYPFLMERTPYSAGPYGEGNYPKSGPGPSVELSREKFIFVYQDVRGRYMSEGDFEEMTPAGGTINESTDTYDTVEWLLKNIPNNNGRVGITGISYPGFYATAALPNAHPAIRAVSPQAPVTDEFMGDDARHNGAFFLLDNFSFMNYFDAPRSGPVANYDVLFSNRTPDVYQFFLNLGPVKNANGAAYFNNKGKIWNEYVQHDTYDAYWQSRDIRRALGRVPTGVATLVVGGWYDAEDLFGALKTYEALEKRPQNKNQLVMGPWTHGAWARREWLGLGDFQFGSNTAQTYRDELETPFFTYYLKDKGTFGKDEARLFNTGTNQWQSFDKWPTTNSQRIVFSLNQNGKLTSTSFKSTSSGTASNSVEYISDPAKPVPYTDGTWSRRNNAYLIEDQRFAARRPDVLVFQTEPLTEDLTLAGPIGVNLRVATTGTDADFIVKVIDVLPDTAQSPRPTVAGARVATMGGYQRLIRADVMRGKFRQSMERPTAFTPNLNVPTTVSFTLNDALHTIKKGHRLMVQVQSSWFPLVDRNPQTFKAANDVTEADYQKATIRLFTDASGITVTVLK
ncbi:hypothetical protein FAES_2536 [Fibrella aestuarina BUZ 2]|uniref:Xaa-Pro dipeptidyl-peptidase C-terminal domain-containing protein n=1 Tax=Fibrella aestuarina BUZ 2 TaxID=1166018 RepID=I0K8U2_9BACT|nr:CocE/NonD family hydrolase [Fibrella aestuarina]CCH00545.1 hypothetical protein FAES_2536 [Fibrella aestuarina BUZ 2]